MRQRRIKKTTAKVEKEEFKTVVATQNICLCGILFIALLSVVAFIYFHRVEVTHKTEEKSIQEEQTGVAEEKSIQELWKEQRDAAENWRRRVVTKWYKGVTDEELDSAARWLDYAKPFDLRRSCAQKSNQLNDTAKQHLSRKIDEFKNNLPKMNSDTVMHKILVNATFHSNAIEGNTLTLEETTLIIAGKRLSPSPALPDEYLSYSAEKDIQETKNHAQALRYLGLTIPGIPAIEFTENMPWQNILKDINSCLLKDISIHGKQGLGGQYRRFPVAIGVEKAILPQPDEVPKLMEMFERWLNQRLTEIRNDEDAIYLACDAHLKFVHIHPFSDGNGRTARILDGLLLGKVGLPLPIFNAKNRQQYLTRVSKALQPENWEMKPMCDLHAQAILTTIDLLMKE